MTAYKLTDTKLRSIRSPGLYSDGNCLYLQVKHGGRSWLLRYTSPTTRKMRDMGLGSADRVTLAQARERARQALAVIADGVDPIDQRKGERAAIREQHTKRAATPTFCADWEAWDREFQRHNTPKHARNQRSMIEKYVLPSLGNMRVDHIDTDDVVKMIKLDNFWYEKTETAQRTLRIVASVLRYAKQAGHRTGDNPAAWENLNYLMKGRPKHQVVHYARIEPDEVPPFMEQLRAIEGVPPRCLEYAIHTAMRSTCVREVRWSEIDLDRRLWTVPKEKLIKGQVRREHDFKLPLTDRTHAILVEMAKRRINDWVFPGYWAGNRPLANSALLDVLKPLRPDATVHGFRSSFRDWANSQMREDKTRMFPYDVMEMALTHKVGNETVEAYQRDDALVLREPLMERWSAYLDGAL